MGAPLIEVRDLVVHFNVGSRGPRLQAVDGVSFTVDTGETLAIVGESGCGKSTVARAIMQLVTPTSGSVCVDGHDLAVASRAERRQRRRLVQTVFQDPAGALDPRMRLGRSIREPLDAFGIGSRRSRDERVVELLNVVGLESVHARRFPHELSGGQKQRANIARALALDPRVLVCDEPVSALDVSLQAEVLNLLVGLRRRLGLSLLLISHDIGVVGHIADRVGVMYLGRLVEVGVVDDVFDRPAHPYTAALLSSQPVALPSWARRAATSPLVGELPSALAPPSGCRFRTRCPEARDLCATAVPVWHDVDSAHAVACHRAEELRDRLRLAVAAPPTPTHHPTVDAGVRPDRSTHNQ